jgi:hypothetical protein
MCVHARTHTQHTLNIKNGNGRRLGVFLGMIYQISKRSAKLWAIFVFVEVCLFSDITNITHVDLIVD